MTFPTPNPHSHALRRGRFSEPGRIYLITTVTHQREPVFEDFDCARIVVRSLRDCHEQDRVSSLCYVLMPDHLHWLIALREGNDLPGLMRLFKGFTGRRVNEYRCRVGEPLWQAGYHDHALRAEEDVRAVARYVIANPLRASLVRHVGQYPHWDAVWL